MLPAALGVLAIALGAYGHASKGLRAMDALRPELLDRAQPGAPQEQPHEKKHMWKANDTGGLVRIEVPDHSPRDAPQEPVTGFSQCGQDWLVASVLGCKRDSFFLDLAANDGHDLSNSFMLEQYFGWSGVCVEANPKYKDSLLKRRCAYVRAAVGSPAGEAVEFEMRDDEPVLGGIVSSSADNTQARGSSKTLHLVPLQHILASVGAPSVIDYFSLDVEGAESLVMKDFPWDQYTFRVLTIERPKEDLVAALRNHNYTFVRVNSEFDDQTWVHTSLPDLQNVLAAWKNGAANQIVLCMTSDFGLQWPGALQH